MILIAALSYLLKIIGGWALIHLIWDSRRMEHLTFKLFLGTGAGLGLSSLMYFCWFVVKLPAARYPLFEFFFFVALLIICLAREYRHKTDLKPRAWKMPTIGQWIWGGLALVALVISSWTFWLSSAKNPHGYNDAWAIWNAAARFIYLGGDGWMSFILKDAWHHADYPLLLALNVADGWAVLGSDSTRIPMLVAFIFFLSLIGLLFSATTLVRGFEQGALAALLIASVPQLPFLASWQYADAPLSYFFLATGALIYLYTVTSEKKLLVLAGLFAALAAWTKNEGVTFALIALIVCALLRLRDMKYFILGAFAPALLIAFYKTLTPGNDLFVDQAKSMAQLLDPTRYQIILSKVISFSLAFGGWSVSFLVVLLCYILFVFVRQKPVGKLWAPILLVAAQFSGYFVIYLMTPHDLVVHLSTSLDRLLFHLFPLTLLVVFMVLPSPREIFAKKQTGIKRS